MTYALRLLFAVSTILFVSGCGGSDDGHDDHGDKHAGHDHDDDKGDDHGDAQDLPDVMIGGVAVKLQQVGGAIKAGEESILLVKLPDGDKGQTLVRAWLGGEDRTQYRTEKGHFVADEDIYDIHITAPDPLPTDAMWWVEVEKPDGTKAVGSTRPITGS